MIQQVALRVLNLTLLMVLLSSCATTPEIQAELEPAPPELPKFPPKSPRFVINDVLFGFDDAKLDERDHEIITPMKQYLEKYPRDRIRIEGHTCDTGDEAYNINLGHRRANAVRDELVRLGIDPARLTTISYGASKPAVPNDWPDKKLNRRVSYYVTHRE